MTSPVTHSIPGSHSRVRIVIADDQSVARFGVKSTLGREEDFLIVGEAEDGEATLAQTTKLQPDILLLDIQMPRSSGPGTIQEVVQESPGVRIILFTGAITPSQSLEALEIGARGIVEKTTMVEDLALAIRTVQAGDYWFHGEPFSNIIQAETVLGRDVEDPKPPAYGLTSRELSAIQCISEGCSNRDIAQQLLISQETVKRHLSNIFDKTGVSTRLELALFAIARHLVVVEAA